jgi:hypothetical protein
VERGGSEGDDLTIKSFKHLLESPALCPLFPSFNVEGLIELSELMMSSSSPPVSLRLFSCCMSTTIHTVIYIVRTSIMYAMRAPRHRSVRQAG